MLNKIIAVIFIFIIAINVNAKTVVIANKAFNEDISESRIKQLYMARVHSLESGTIIEAFLPRENKVRMSFFKHGLNSNERKMLKKYGRIVFSGEGTTPPIIPSADVLIKVASSVKAIGVIDSSLINDSVKVIATY